MSATDEGRICEFEFFGPVNGGYAYCRIERVDNQGLPALRLAHHGSGTPSTRSPPEPGKDFSFALK
jgi:hypothetical protein